MAEKLNKEREGRTDKVMKKKGRKKERERKVKKKIAREFLSLHPCLSQLKRKKKKKNK